MRGTQCIHSTRQALYRVFVFSNTQLNDLVVSKLPLSKSIANPPARNLTQTRPYAKKSKAPQDKGTDYNAHKDVPYDIRYTTKKSFEQSGKSRLPIDHEITDPKVMVIDISGGEPEGPLNPKFILSRIDPSAESLRMISPYVPATDKIPAKLPVCRVFNKKEEVDRQRNLKEKKKENAAPKTKDMELGWAITDHDLGFKVKQLTAFLEKGMMVNVLLGRKKGSKPTEEARCREVVDFVTEEAFKVEARERKKGDGQLGKSYRLSFQGKMPTKKSKESEGVVERKPDGNDAAE